MRPPRWHAAALIAVFGAAPGTAQELLWEQRGVPGQLQVGGASAFVGDVDGDGFEDLVATAAVISPIESQIHLRSGRDGSLLRIDRPLSNHAIVTLSAAGDMDGDGVRDYAFASTRILSPVIPDLSLIEVRSAKTGTALWQVTAPRTYQLGERLAGGLDADGDGRPDLIATAPGDNERMGAVHVYNNAGTLLYKWLGIASSLGSLGGDLDGDGAEEFLRSGPSEDRTGGVYVHSGRTGRILVAGFGQQFGDGLGIKSVIGSGDVDGDGLPDFAASSSTIQAEGLVRVFSGHSGSPIYTWRRPLASLFGDEMVAADLDLDGVQDLLIGLVTCKAMPTTSALEWRSLRTGGEMTQICAPDPRVGNFGLEPFSIGASQPGHPFPVIVGGEPLFREQFNLGQGRLLCFRATPANVQPLGTACAGTLPQPPRIGFVDRGSAGPIVHLSRAPAGAAAALLVGLSSTSWAGTPLPLALDRFGLLGCSIQTSVEVALPVTTGTIGIDAGYASFPIPLPLNGGLGVTINAQWMLLDLNATPTALTGALTWRH